MLTCNTLQALNILINIAFIMLQLYTYRNEIGYQHFGLIVTMFHNKAFVVPMSGNKATYHQAYGKENPNGKNI